MHLIGSSLERTPGSPATCWNVRWPPASVRWARMPVCAGVLPTPGVAAIAAKLGACAGIVVSASHNPYADNGIKVFDGNGFKLSESVEQALEARILKESNPGSPSHSQVVGRCDAIMDALDYYGDFLVEFCSGFVAGRASPGPGLLPWCHISGGSRCVFATGRRDFCPFR